MVTASVLLPIFRPGGLDVTFAGLRDQTRKDFELILIDARYERRHDAVMAMAREYGVPTWHVPEHRRNGKYAVVAAAWNTGFMLAQGRIILMLPDYGYVKPDWIERHLDYHQQSKQLYVLSPYRFLSLPPVLTKARHPIIIAAPETASALPETVVDQPGDEFDECAIFPERFDPSWITWLKPWPDDCQCLRVNSDLVANTVPVSTHIHLRNESTEREGLLAMNGLDENLDRGKAHIDIEFGRRVDACGLNLIVDRENWCWVLNPRTLFPTMPYLRPGRWTYEECEAWGFRAPVKEAPNPYKLRDSAPELRVLYRTAPIPVARLDVPDDLYFP